MKKPGRTFTLAVLGMAAVAVSLQRPIILAQTMSRPGARPKPAMRVAREARADEPHTAAATNTADAGPGDNLFDPWDLPDPTDMPLDPPDPWTDPFDPLNDLPLPEIPDFPPEWDGDPFDDELPLPDPPDLEDPFPDEPSLFASPGIGGEQLGYFTATLGFGARAAAGSNEAAVNVPTGLMPFPMRLPFSPVMLPGQPRATPKRRTCDPTFATTVLIPEPKRNSLYFLNTCTKAVSRVPVGARPVGVARTPDGKSALVANSGSGSISIVDLASRTTVGTISLPSFEGFPGQPNGIVITPDGATAYVSNHDDALGSVVWVIDLATRTVLKTIPVGGFPAGIAMMPDGSQVWVASRADDVVTVIDTLTNTALFNLPSVTLATGVAFNPTGTRAYVLRGIEGGGTLLVYDTSTYEVVAFVPVGRLPHAVAVTPTGRHVFVTNALSNSISQIDTATNKVIRTINLRGKHPLGLTFIQ